MLDRQVQRAQCRGGGQVIDQKQRRMLLINPQLTAGGHRQPHAVAVPGLTHACRSQHAASANHLAVLILKYKQIVCIRLLNLTQKAALHRLQAPRQALFAGRQGGQARARISRHLHEYLQVFLPRAAHQHAIPPLPGAGGRR